MTESPMALIRKLDETAEALLRLAKQVREAAPEVEDAELRQEMEASATEMERRAGEMAEAIRQFRSRIN